MERGVEKPRTNARLEEALQFRQALPVTEAALYRSGDTFPICSRCSSPMEREYQRFCDRCGQRLGWKEYSRALIITRF